MPNNGYEYGFIVDGKKYILDMHGISGRIWLLYNKEKNKVHTVLTFEEERQNYEVSDVTAFVRIGQQPEFLLEKLK